MKSFFIFSILFNLLVLCSNTFAESTVPDFSVQIGQILSQKNAKPTATQKWLLKFIPPTHFHFNTDAPMKVAAPAASVNFVKASAGLEEVGFVGADTHLHEGMRVEAELYLCDDQKTMCVRKVLGFVLQKNSDFTEFTASGTEVKTPSSADLNPNSDPNSNSKSKSKKSISKKTISEKTSKDEHGFWINDADAAIAESMRSGKPLLIDFYGIWCPPCNLYNETVFPKKEFARAAKNWVLLKMDADDSKSFALKSKFKIGGYPTLVAIKNPATSEISALAEIDRIVGYYPLHEFLNMLGDAYTNRKMTLDEKLVAQKNAYLKTLQAMLSMKIEQEDFKSALALAKEGERLSGEDHFFPLSVLSIRATDQPLVLKEPAATDLIRSIYEGRARESNETLLKFEDLLTSKSDQFTKTQIAWVNEVLDTLANRTIPETLSVPGVELSIADIDSMRVDVAEALTKDEGAKGVSVNTTSGKATEAKTTEAKTTEAKTNGATDLVVNANARAAASYQKMISVLHLENSRGMNLELSHYLWKSGDFQQAKAIFSKFIKLYPNEFTFYYAEAKMDLDLKDLPSARVNAEKAVKFAYGDNKLRATERLVRVLAAQGESALAVRRGNQTLSEIKPVSETLDVRTNHYIKALKKAVEDAEKGTS